MESTYHPGTVPHSYILSAWEYSDNWKHFIDLDKLNFKLYKCCSYAKFTIFYYIHFIVVYV